MTYTLTTTFVGLEDVTVPAGTFAKCAKVTFTYTNKAGSNTTTKWFAPGVGLVEYRDAGSGDIQTLKGYSG